MVERNRLEVYEIDLKVIHNLWITLWRFGINQKIPLYMTKGFELLVIW